MGEDNADKASDAEDLDEEDSAEEPSSAEVVMAAIDTFNNPQVIEKISAYLKDRNDIERDRLAFEKAAQKEVNIEWQRKLINAYWVRAVLSALVVVTVAFLGYVHVLDSAVLAALLTAVVASLFVQPKKGE